MLPIHKPKDGSSLRVFGGDEEPPYDVDLFHEYFKFTYYSICQIMGIEVGLLIEVEHMVLTIDV